MNEFHTTNLPEIDDVGRVETYGIDVIPQHARHGKPRDLFFVWLAFNITYYYLIIGGILMILGLNVLEASLVVLIGNLGAFSVGLISVTGPVSGTCTMVVGRAQYGTNGNRLVNASVTWISDVAYEAINLSICAIALFALLSYEGLHVNIGMKVGVLLLTMIATFTLSIYGHATIVRYTKYLTIAFAVFFLVLFGFVSSHAKLSYQPSHPLHGSSLIATILVGLTLVLAGALGPGNSSAEYARYLPADSSRKAIVWWSTSGAYLSAVFLSILGILAGTVVNMNNPQTSMRALMPGWFYIPFLLMIFAGTMANGVLTTYSSGLTLQAMGLTARRTRTVLIDATLASAMTAYALFVSNFLTSMGNFLSLMVIWYGPFTAIFFVDVIMRSGMYDGEALLEGSYPYAFPKGFNWSGVIAMISGMVTAGLCINTTPWQGPISKALNGADISPFVGVIVGGLVYWGLSRRSLNAKGQLLFVQRAQGTSTVADLS